MSRERGKALIRENLSIALDILTAHKMRSGLIILGVAIGIAALMGIVSIMLGLVDMIGQRVRSSEATVLIVDKFDFLVGGFDEAMLHRKDITDDDAKAIRAACPSLHHVGYVVRQIGAFYTLRSGNEKSRMITIMGVEPALMYVLNLDLELGRVFTDEEVFHRTKVVVLGHSPRRDLFPNTDPIGRSVKIGNDDYRVVGAFEAQRSLFGSLGDNFALVPYTTYKISLWKEFDLRSVYAVVRDGVSVETAKDEVIRVMRSRRRLKANQENDFSVTSIDAALELIGKITAPIAGVLAAISSIGLLVGGIGVMNIMLVSVTERTDEIGLRKAVGATRQDILWQFLLEAGILTGLGGVLGIGMGLSAALVVSALTGLPSAVSVFYIFLGVLMSVGIGIFFGLYPASRASKLDPVQAMSYPK
jgi:putative ABC transport system permease protein